MGATLDALHQLQIIETQLRSVREQMDSKRRAVQGHQRRLAAIEKQIQENRDQTREAQAEADRMELDRNANEAHVAKLREALNKTKTNKEYAAALTQLNTDKADMAKIEDAVLSALSRVDELKKKEAELRVHLEKEQSRMADQVKAAAEVEARLSGRLKDLERQRADAASQVPPEALQLFERACEAHEGEGMASIEQTHPKRAEYICSGCNISLTLETINSLQTRDTVLQCQTCSRILYLEAPSHVHV
jgi:uncharacterized protein